MIDLRKPLPIWAWFILIILAVRVVPLIILLLVHFTGTAPLLRSLFLVFAMSLPALITGAALFFYLLSRFRQQKGNAMSTFTGGLVFFLAAFYLLNTWILIAAITCVGYIAGFFIDPRPRKKQ